MPVLVENVRDPHRRREREHVPAVAGRPVGNREPGVVARDEAPRQNQQDRAGDEELGKTVKHGSSRSSRSGRSGGIELGFTHPTHLTYPTYPTGRRPPSSWRLPGP